jgi:hypothetical protein
MTRAESEDGWVELSVAAGADRNERPREAATLELCPRSAPQLLDLGAEVLVMRLLACVGVCALIWFPLRAITPWFVAFLATNPVGTGGDEGFINFVYSMLFLMTAQSLAGIVSTTSVTVLVHSELVGRSAGPMEALGYALRRLPALVGVFLVDMIVIGLTGGVLGVVSILCLCPFLLPVAVGLYLFFKWKFSVAPSALVLEQLGVLESIRRSWELTRGSFPRWLGVSVLAFLLVSGFTAGLQLGDDPGLREKLLRGLGLPGLVFDTLFVAISSVFSGVSTAFISAAMTVYYLDTRMRREGFDLSMRLERLRGARGGAV